MPLPHPLYDNIPVWDDKVVKQLPFIKKHKRHLAGIKNILSAVAFSFVITNVLIITMRGYFTGQLGKEYIPLLYIGLFIVLFVLIIIISALARGFSIITTKYLAPGNIEIIHLFLEAQEIEVFQHPEAPELLQIVGEKGKDKKEIIFFIANDYEILIDSVFTFRPSGINPVLSYKKRMANRLRDWITIHASDTNFVY